MSATTTQLLSSGQFSKLRYDTIHLLKVHLPTFLSIPVTQKCQTLSSDTLAANNRFTTTLITSVWSWRWACVASYCHGILPRRVSHTSRNSKC